MKRFVGRRIAISGAASGIGAAVAALFAEEGARLALLDKSVISRELAASPSVGYTSEVDVTNADAVHRFMAEAAEAMGGIDGLVNAAGILQSGPLAQISFDDWKKTIDVNLTGTWLVCRAALDYLNAAENSTIVNISSGLGIRPVPNYAAYSASKAAVIALTKVLAMELAPKIRANTVCPGAVDTPMTAGLYADDVVRQASFSNYALKRFGTALEIAQAVRYLTSNESGFVTGISLPVDGGRTFQ